jgi:hypothetical protein
LEVGKVFHLMSINHLAANQRRRLSEQGGVMSNPLTYERRRLKQGVNSIEAAIETLLPDAAPRRSNQILHEQRRDATNL